MRYLQLVLVLAGAAAAAGCAQPTRSRDTANPNVDAVVLAQQVCSNCHGVTGNSVSPNFPILAGQTPEYITAQLSGFRSKARRDPAGFEYMWGLSRSLTDEQIKGLAEYYSGRTPERRPVEGDVVRIAAGAALFANGLPEKNVPACAACHGKDATGNATFPRLAGQHVDYVVKQLLVFQRTDERPEGVAMKMVAHELARDDIENVAAFVQALPNR
jgi:cytochrome c553